MKISAKELLQEDRGNGWHSVPMKERVPDDVKGIVYYPCLNQFEDYPTAEKAFRRIRRAVDYARQKNPGIRGVLGLSTHRHWTPYRYETSPRGGKPKKVFNPAVRYKTRPHLHLFLYGQGARSLTEKISKRELGDEFNKHKIQVYKNGFPRSYVIQQSDCFREWQ